MTKTLLITGGMGAASSVLAADRGYDLYLLYLGYLGPNRRLGQEDQIQEN